MESHRETRMFRATSSVKPARDFVVGHGAVDVGSRNRYRPGLCAPGMQETSNSRGNRMSRVLLGKRISKGPRGVSDPRMPSSISGFIVARAVRGASLSRAAASPRSTSPLRRTMWSRSAARSPRPVTDAWRASRAPRPSKSNMPFMHAIWSSQSAKNHLVSVTSAAGDRFPRPPRSP